VSGALLGSRSGWPALGAQVGWTSGQGRLAEASQVLEAGSALPRIETRDNFVVMGLTSDHQFRPIRLADAIVLWRFVEASDGLDRNSFYCYVVIAEMFGHTSIIAEDPSGSPVGFVTALPLPKDPSELFIWQLYVDPNVRGNGIAGTLLWEAVQAAGASVVRATVNPDNHASMGAFRSLAKRMGSRLVTREYLSSSDFPPEVGPHDSEHLVSIGVED
jgi:L-2,4-diaminobutyric acid acetyltransferase